MEIEKKDNKITVFHELKKSETYKFLKGKKYETFSVFKKPIKVIGFSNITSDGFGILTADYDRCDIGVIEEDWKLIQNLYKLPPAYIFESSKNKFHLLCLAKFPHGKIYEILQHTRIDDNYKTMPLRTAFRSYVIRISPKRKKGRPKFLKVLGKDKNLNKEISEAHLKFLKKIYPKIPDIPYSNKDGLSKIKINDYETIN